MGVYRCYIGVYGDNGKEHGNYYNGLFRVMGLVAVRELKLSSHDGYIYMYSN